MKDLSNEVILHQNTNETEYIQFRKLLEYPELQHCFTLKSNGLNFKKYSEENNPVELSYAKISKALNWNQDSIVKPHQTHTDRIEIVQDAKEQWNEVDGLITDKKGIVLCTTEADCTGLLFYDPIHKVIGDIHSGWRGTLQRIGQKAVQKMVEVYHSCPEDIICCICPHIRKCHFEVENDVKELFEEEFMNMLKPEKFIINGKSILRDGELVQKYFIDTTLLNIFMLKEMGLKNENIIDSGICTVCESKQFHSYRGEKASFGTNATMIEIR